jgi:hypothetical protein
MGPPADVRWCSTRLGLDCCLYVVYRVLHVFTSYPRLCSDTRVTKYTSVMSKKKKRMPQQEKDPHRGCARRGKKSRSDDDQQCLYNSKTEATAKVLFFIGTGGVAVIITIDSLAAVRLPKGWGFDSLTMRLPRIGHPERSRLPRGNLW